MQWELLVFGLVVAIAALLIIVWQAREAGDVSRSEEDLDATAAAAKRVEEARQRRVLRGRALLRRLRRDAQD